jgi:hypothetical protein
MDSMVPHAFLQAMSFIEKAISEFVSKSITVFVFKNPCLRLNLKQGVFNFFGTKLAGRRIWMLSNWRSTVVWIRQGLKICS